MTIQMASFPLPLGLRNLNARPEMAIGQTKTREFVTPSPGVTRDNDLFNAMRADFRGGRIRPESRLFG